MRNLLERLKPEVFESLQREKILYPFSMRCLEDDLRKNLVCTYLTVDSAYRLVGLTGGLTFGISELVNCFNEL
jgi:hypothetical protein